MPKTTNYTTIIFLTFVVIVGALIAITLFSKKESSSDSLDYLTSEDYVTTIETNKFSVKLYGKILQEGKIKELNYIEDVTNALEELSSIINNNLKTNINFYIVNGSEDSSVASAIRKESYKLNEGGTILIYKDFEEDFDVSYKDIIIHEILHILGIGTHSKWLNCVLSINKNKYLLGSAGNFEKTYKYYIENLGFKENTYKLIPLGPGAGHWDENNFTDEMMTPEIRESNNLKLSILTGKALEDIGWDINYSSKYFEDWP